MGKRRRLPSSTPGIARIRRFLSLPRRDRERFLIAWVVLVLARLGLWLAPFRSIQRIIDRVAPGRPRMPVPAPDDVERIAWAVASAARFVPQASCLTQALAAKVILEREGRPAEVCVGVARVGRGAIEAHAWVESDGRIVIGGHDLSRYSRLGSPTSLSDVDVSREGCKRQVPPLWRTRRLWRLCRNAAFDARYGAFLGGSVRTRYAHLGAHDTENTDYVAMKAIFHDRIRAGDLLVEVGCGKGRVINYWLSLRLKNRIVGIEIDPDISNRTRRRLERGFPNVAIVTGDAADELPRDASLIYLANPFDRSTMEKFKGRVEERCPSATLLYYNPVHISVFQDDPAWLVEEIELESLLPRGYATWWPVSGLAVLRRVDGAGGRLRAPSSAA